MSYTATDNHITPPVCRTKRHNTIPAPLGATYNIGGVDFPVKEYMTFPELGLHQALPVIQTISDYKWQYDALMSRLKNKELYAEHENVEETIERLKQWLIEDRHKAAPGDPIYAE